MQYRLGLIVLLCGLIISCSAGVNTPAPTQAQQPTTTATIGSVTATLPPTGVPATAATTATPTGSGYAIRFFGSSNDDLDRIKIPLGTINSSGQLTTSRPVNVSGDLTIEFWMKAFAGDNTAPDCDGWYYGNIIIDRDVFWAGDYGDYGIAICANKLVVGFSVGSDDRLLKGNTIITDGAWHHIAVTRANSGQVRLFVDGQIDATMTGPSGRIDYRLNRPTDYPNSDPYLVFGAEKHNVTGSLHYNGLLDDIRISNVVRYTDPFSRPTAPHAIDANTIALYRFDEGSGTTIGDSTPGNQSPGELKPRPGGAAQHWSTDTPFTSSSVPLTPHAFIPMIIKS